MIFELNKSQTFRRYTEILNKKRLCTHLYMPWSKEIDNEFLFKVKAQIKNAGCSYIPFMDLDGRPLSLTDDDIHQINDQLHSSDKSETHLIMFNQEVIHVLKVTNIFSELSQDVETLDCFSTVVPIENYTAWIEVSDLYVMDVNYLGVKEDLNKKLLSLLDSTHLFDVFAAEQINTTIDETKKWVEAERQVTYDYFMRGCELEETIYPNCWNSLSRKSQHQLVCCELQRKESSSLRNTQKWNSLTESFCCYKEALFWELNEIYIFPLVDTIHRYESFSKLWSGFVQGDGGKDKGIQLVDRIFKGESELLDDIGSFLYYMEHIKVLTFSLKNQFSKKFHSAEFLMVEKFLDKQESKIESFRHKEFSNKLSIIRRIQEWIAEVDENILLYNAHEVKNCNLKLTHLLSLMNSSSGTNNLFFELLEEKMERNCMSPNLKEEVETLFNDILLPRVA